MCSSVDTSDGVLHGAGTRTLGGGKDGWPGGLKRLTCAARWNNGEVRPGEAIEIVVLSQGSF